MGLDLINFDLPIEYIDGSPARVLHFNEKFGYHSVTPRGDPNCKFGNFYDCYGNHVYGDSMRIRNSTPPPPPPLEVCDDHPMFGLV